MTTDELAQLSEVRGMVRTGRARQIRLLAGVSVAETARTIGVTPATLARWEMGLHVPKGGRALRYREALQALAGQ